MVTCIPWLTVVLVIFFFFKDSFLGVARIAGMKRHFCKEWSQVGVHFVRRVLECQLVAGLSQKENSLPTINFQGLCQFHGKLFFLFYLTWGDDPLITLPPIFMEVKHGPLQ